jgi:hypothetical protein
MILVFSEDKIPSNKRESRIQYRHNQETQIEIIIKQIVAEQYKYSCQGIKIDDCGDRWREILDVKDNRAYPEDHEYEYIPYLTHIPEIRIHSCEDE